MNPVKVRNIEIGTGIPKICVPIVGLTRKEIIESAEKAAVSSADMIEWRADWFEHVEDFEKAGQILAALREVLKDIPILFTFRTEREGGQKTMDSDTYIRLNKKIIKTGLADIVDVELFTGDEAVKEIVGEAHACGVKVIASSHDFHKTPSKEELVFRLCKMAELGADILKIAVMPQNLEDVVTLLSMTAEVTENHVSCPVITMSMSGTGTISRLTGEAFGSAVTFGALGKVSAPGQIDVEKLRVVLNHLHDCLKSS